MSGRYVTLETEVWVDDSELEIFLEDFKRYFFKFLMKSMT